MGIILKHLPKDIQQSSCDLIRAGPPCPPDPPSSEWTPDPFEFYQEGARIEAAFRKYFHRAEPSQEKTSVEVLVCHGNVIRYFVCRALQWDPRGWLRMASTTAASRSSSSSPVGVSPYWNWA